MDVVAQSSLLNSYMGFTSNATRLWVPDEFRVQDKKGNFAVPRDKWPLFKIRSLTGAEILEVQDLSVTVITPDGNTLVQDNMGMKKQNVINVGLVGVKDWTIDAKKISWSDSNKQEIIDSMPPILMNGLYLAIMNNSHLTKEEADGLEY